MKYELCLEIVRDLETVKRHHLKSGPVVTTLANLMHKYQVTDLRILDELTEALLSVNSGKSENSPLEITPQELLEAEVLEKEISPWVRELRKDMFGKEDVPFPNRESALEWLGKYALSDQEVLDEFEKFLQSKDSEGGQIIHSVMIIEGMDVLKDTPPAILWDKTEEIARETGAIHSSLIMHVLANTRLICPKWDLTGRWIIQRLPSGAITEVKSATIIFRGTLNFEDMIQIYDDIKGKFQFRKSKQLNAKHLELYRLVNESKIPQKKGKVAFWKQIMEDWNRRHPEAKYSTWKGISMAYTRVAKKVGRRFQASASVENTIGVLFRDVGRIELNLTSDRD